MRSGERGKGKGERGKGKGERGKGKGERVRDLKPFPFKEPSYLGELLVVTNPKMRL